MMGHFFVPSTKILHIILTVPCVQRRLGPVQLFTSMYHVRRQIQRWGEALLAKICLNFALECSDPVY